MNAELFDPEDFLDIRPVAPAARRAALPPIVTPPRYQRSRGGASPAYAAVAAPAQDFTDWAPEPAPRAPDFPARAMAAAPAAEPAPVDATQVPIVAPPVYPRRGEAAPRAAMTAEAPAFQTRRTAAGSDSIARAPAMPRQDRAEPAKDADTAPAPRQTQPAPRPAAPGHPGWLRVICEGIALNLRAWNANGFTLETPLPLDDETLRVLVFDVTLLIGQGATRLEMQTRVRADCSQTAIMTQAERFLFVDLDPEQSEILHRAASLSLARKRVSVMQLLNAAEAPQTAPQTAPQPVPQAVPTQWTRTAPRPLILPQPRTARMVAVAPADPFADAFAEAPAAWRAAPFAEPAAEPRADQPADRPAFPRAAPPAEPPSEPPAGAAPAQTPPRGRGYRPSLRALSVLGALAIIGGFAWNNASGVTARYGAVTVSATSLAAPAAGIIEWLPLQPGQSVETGEILGHLRPVAMNLSPLIAQLLAEANDPAAPLVPLAGPQAGDPRGTPVRAPCDCRLHELARADGAQAAAGETLATFAGREAPVIHVLVRADQAAGLAIGNVALIDLADGTSLQGRVARLPGELAGSQTLGLAEHVFGAENYARVEIRPDSLLSVPAGTGAAVTLHTSAPWGWLRARTHALSGQITALAGL